MSQLFSMETSQLPDKKDESEDNGNQEGLPEESGVSFVPTDKPSDIEYGTFVETFHPEEEPKSAFRYLGLLYSLVATNCFSLSTTILKKYKHIHPFTIGVFAFPPAALLSFGLIMYTVLVHKQKIAHTFWPIQKHKAVTVIMLVRAVASTTVYYLLIWAFQYITVADTITIMSASVIPVYLYGWLCLGESCGIVPSLMAVSALCGITIISRPPIITGDEVFDQKTLIGVSLALLCLVLATIGVITVKYVIEIHHGVLNTFLYTWAFGQSLVLAWGFGELKIPNDPMDILALAAVGVLLNSGMTFVVLALQIEEAGVVSLVRTSEVVCTFFWQWVIVGVLPDGVSVVGAAFVMTGVIVITLRKYIASLQKTNKWRNRLGFLLK